MSGNVNVFALALVNLLLHLIFMRIFTANASLIAEAWVSFGKHYGGLMA